MSDSIIPSSKRVLESIDRVSEVLFGPGFAFGRMTGRSPWLVGLCMVLLGAVLVAMTIALGG